MPYRNIKSGKDYFVSYAILDNEELIGYTYCHDIALKISQETGFSVKDVDIDDGKTTIDKTKPMIEWILNEEKFDENGDNCCVIL